MTIPPPPPYPSKTFSNDDGAPVPIAMFEDLHVTEPNPVSEARRPRRTSLAAVLLGAGVLLSALVHVIVRRTLSA